MPRDFLQNSCKLFHGILVCIVESVRKSIANSKTAFSALNYNNILNIEKKEKWAKSTSKPL